MPRQRLYIARDCWWTMPSGSDGYWTDENGKLVDEVVCAYKSLNDSSLSTYMMHCGGGVTKGAPGGGPVMAAAFTKNYFGRLEQTNIVPERIEFGITASGVSSMAGVVPYVGINGLELGTIESNGFNGEVGTASGVFNLTLAQRQHILSHRIEDTYDFFNVYFYANMETPPADVFKSFKIYTIEVYCSGNNTWDNYTVGVPVSTTTYAPIRSSLRNGSEWRNYSGVLIDTNRNYLVNPDYSWIIQTGPPAYISGQLDNGYADSYFMPSGGLSLFYNISPQTVTDVTTIEQYIQKIIPNLDERRDYLNFATSICCSKDGSTLFIGQTTRPSGIVYVFTNQGSGSWSRIQTLSPNDRVYGESEYDNFGGPLLCSNDGSNLFVSKKSSWTETVYPASYNKGSVYVFANYGSGSWSQIQKIELAAGVPTDEFGNSIACDASGSCLFIGAPGHNSNFGAAYVFINENSGSWSQRQKLTASNAALYDYFGINICCSKDSSKLFISAPSKNASSDNVRCGSAYAFTNEGSGSWSQIQEIIPDTRTSDQYFGTGLGCNASGTRLFISSINDGYYTSLNGAVYAFTNYGSGSWSQIQKIRPGNSYNGDRFGLSNIGCDASGVRLLIGAPGVNNLAGAVYIFTDYDNDDNWSETYKILSSNTDDITWGNFFGLGNAFGYDGSGLPMFITSYLEDTSPYINDGAAFIFRDIFDIDSTSTSMIRDKSLSSITRAILRLRASLPLTSGLYENARDAIKINGYSNFVKDNDYRSYLTNYVDSTLISPRRYGYVLYGAGPIIEASGFQNYDIELNFLNPFDYNTKSGDIASIYHRNVDMFKDIELQFIGLPSGIQISAADLLIQRIPNDSLTLHTIGGFAKRDYKYAFPDIVSAYLNNENIDLFYPRLGDYNFGKMHYIGNFDLQSLFAKAFFEFNEQSGIYTWSSTSGIIGGTLSNSAGGGTTHRYNYYRKPHPYHVTSYPYYRNLIDLTSCYINFGNSLDDVMYADNSFTMYFVFGGSGIFSDWSGTLFRRGTTTDDMIRITVDNTSELYPLSKQINLYIRTTDDSIDHRYIWFDSSDNPIMLIVNFNYQNGNLYPRILAYGLNGNFATSRWVAGSDWHTAVRTAQLDGATNIIGENKSSTLSFGDYAAIPILGPPNSNTYARRILPNNLSIIEFGITSGNLIWDANPLEANLVGQEYIGGFDHEVTYIGISDDLWQKFINSRLYTPTYVNPDSAVDNIYQRFNYPLQANEIAAVNYAHTAQRDTGFSLDPSGDIRGITWKVPTGSGAASWNIEYGLVDWITQITPIHRDFDLANTWSDAQDAFIDTHLPNLPTIYKIVIPKDSAYTNNDINPSSIYAECLIDNHTDHPSGLQLSMYLKFDGGRVPNWKICESTVTVPSGINQTITLPFKRHYNCHFDDLFIDSISDLTFELHTNFINNNKYYGDVNIKSIKFMFDVDVVAATGDSQIPLYTHASAAQSRNDIDLYLFNNYAFNSLDLYLNTAWENNSSIPLYTWAISEDASISGIYNNLFLYIHGHESSGAIITLFTFNAERASGINEEYPSGLPLYLFSHGVVTNDIPLYLQGPLPWPSGGVDPSGNISPPGYGPYLPLFLKNIPPKRRGRRMPLFTWCTENPGIYSHIKMMIKNDGGTEWDRDYMLPLYLLGLPFEETASYMNLYLYNKPDSLSNIMSMFALGPSGINNYIRLYTKSARSDGSLPGEDEEGGIPVDTNMPLFINRLYDSYASQIALIAKGPGGINDNIPMIIEGGPNDDYASITMYVSGSGTIKNIMKLYSHGF